MCFLVSDGLLGEPVFEGWLWGWLGGLGVVFAELAGCFGVAHASWRGLLGIAPARWERVIFPATSIEPSCGVLGEFRVAVGVVAVAAHAIDDDLWVGRLSEFVPDAASLLLLLLERYDCPEFIEAVILRCCGLCHRNFRGCLGFGVYGRFRDG